MIALDIDGTLVDDDLALGERTRAAIGRAVQRGVRVSLVTGRMTSSAVRFAATLGLHDPVVGYQGALAREMPVARGSRRAPPVPPSRSGRRSPARRWRGAGPSGSTRTSTTWSS